MGGRETILVLKRPTFIKGLIHAVGEILETVQDDPCRSILLARDEDNNLHLEIVMKNVDFDKFSIGDLGRK